MTAAMIWAFKYIRNVERYGIKASLDDQLATIDVLLDDASLPMNDRQKAFKYLDKALMKLYAERDTYGHILSRTERRELRARSNADR